MKRVYLNLKYLMINFIPLFLVNLLIKLLNSVIQFTTHINLLKICIWFWRGRRFKVWLRSTPTNTSFIYQWLNYITRWGNRISTRLEDRTSHMQILWLNLMIKEPATIFYMVQLTSLKIWNHILTLRLALVYPNTDLESVTH